MSSERASQQAFWGVSALLLAASAAGTIVWSTSMSAMGEMPMPGGWTMSMAWMRMPGQTWAGAAASFLCMWVVMMVAMMLPSLVPMLWRYRQAVGRTGETRLGRLTALVGVGYFFVWTVFGVAAFPLGVALAAVEVRWPALRPLVPGAGGVVLLVAGALQLTAWKTRQLERCRGGLLCGRAPSGTGWSAYRDGVRYGVHCCLCCAGFMLALLVFGMMDLGAVAGITALITLERVASRPEHAARAAGIVLLAAAALRIPPVGDLHQEDVVSPAAWFSDRSRLVQPTSRGALPQPAPEATPAAWRFIARSPRRIAPPRRIPGRPASTTQSNSAQ